MPFIYGISSHKPLLFSQLNEIPICLVFHISNLSFWFCNLDSLLLHHRTLVRTLFSSAPFRLPSVNSSWISRGATKESFPPPISLSFQMHPTKRTTKRWLLVDFVLFPWRNSAFHLPIPKLIQPSTALLVMIFVGSISSSIRGITISDYTYEQIGPRFILLAIFVLYRVPFFLESLLDAFIGNQFNMHRA